MQQARSAEGEAFEVHALPTPPPRFVDQKRVPESYCNFLFANGIVIVPTFQCDETDDAALKLFAQLLPDRKIVPLDATDLILGTRCLSLRIAADRMACA